MKIHYKDTIKKLVLLLMASLLLAFGSNWYTVQEKEQWQAGSEELIWNRISNAMENGLWADGGFIGWVKSVQGESTDFPTVYEKGIPGGSDFSVYDRQVGLQGTVGAAFAMAAKRLGVSAYFVQRILWITTTGLMIFMLLLLAKWACFEWGGGSGRRDAGVPGACPVDAAQRRQYILGDMDNDSPHGRDGLLGLLRKA